MNDEQIDKIWTSHSPESIDRVGVEQRAKSQRRRLNRELLGEVLGGTGAIGVALYFVSIHLSPVTLGLLGVCIGVVVLSVSSQVALRRAVLKIGNESVGSHLQKQQQEVFQELRFTKFGLYGFGFAALVIIAWAIWAGLEWREGYARQPWRWALGFGGILTILVFGIRGLKKKVHVLKNEDAKLRAWLTDH